MKGQKSFSLIEMVIVVGVMGLVLPIMFSIIFLIIQQQVRIYALQEVKRQGDQALFSMRSTIRQYGYKIANPTLVPYPTIIDICPILPNPTLTPMPFIYIYNKDAIGFSYGLITPTPNKIASNSAHVSNPISNLNLTNENVNIEDLKFNCYRTNQFSPAVVSIYFKVTKAGNDADPPSMDYSTKFQMKSY